MPLIDSSPAGPAVSGAAKRWRAGTLVYTTGGLAIVFLWLLWGDFAWSMKDRTVHPVLQLLFKKFEASDTLSGLLLGSLPQALAMILGPIVAYKSDRHRGRWGRRIPFLLIPTPIAVLAMIGLAFSPVIGGRLHGILGPHSPGLYPSVLIFLGLFWTLFEFATIVANSVFGALMNDVLPPQVLGRFFGMVRALSLVAGMVFGYWIMGKAESYYVWVFVGMAALYGIGFTMMCLKVKEGQYPPPPPEGPRRGPVAFFVAARNYFKECFGIPYYWWYYAMIALSWATFTPVNLFNIFFAKSIHMDMTAYGKCLTLTYGISLVLAYPLGMLADRFHPLRMGLLVQVLLAVETLWGGLFIRDSATFSIAMVATGVLSGTWMTVAASVAQRLLPKEEFAQFHSAGGIVIGLLGIVTSPAVGLILDHTHHVYRYTYLMTCCLDLAALFCGYVLYRKFRARGGPKNYVAPE